ncbi:MAG: hypothetical protein KGI75_01315 [Rhizobiaceae bacterium]|nr:hypothetical protein [Rhizobiaceae bacterium]
MSQPISPITLRSSSYVAVVDVEMGSTVLSLQWLTADGRSHDLLVPSGPGNNAFDAGCFIMAPFTNRIADGTFLFEGERISFPVNQPAQGNAIHGLARERPWEIVEQGPESLTTIDRCRDDGSGYTYDLTQTIRLDHQGASFELSVVNCGPAPRPFGLGYHPWFVRSPAARLAFHAETKFRHDSRGLPEAPRGIGEGCDFAGPAGQPVPSSLHAHYAGWAPRNAELLLPTSGLAILMSAGGALTNLQIYAPEGRETICIEPVSHIPDIHNRPELARYGDITVLKPGERLVGSMTIAATKLTPLSTVVREGVGKPT